MYQKEMKRRRRLLGTNLSNSGESYTCVSYRDSVVQEAQAVYFGCRTRNVIYCLNVNVVLNKHETNGYITRERT